eukprot:CAMPEP_0116893662 /NCGR_PEP_ID=MMETSP0467-20121206/3601_1 /TAXON_ID=283647 /ORGANISM="Mesodinium pulex, Strain SPMC105" /LENGTH=56 /DNA_ID=CAMNT_0004563447 /DNA_START=17 /DNA_END=187 /DNA_ORIENTATION=-
MNNSYSFELKDLCLKCLDRNTDYRIRIEQILKTSWILSTYKPSNILENPYITQSDR